MSPEYNKLYEYFKTFPGIGKRQAERFVYHILTKEEGWINSFMSEVQKSRQNVLECIDCVRIFKNKYGESFNKCEVCRSQVRDRSSLAIVEKNIDANVMLQKASWNGLVFVLGGVYQVIEKRNPPKVHLEELIKFVKNNSFKEILICNSLNSDGEFTAQIIKQKIKDLEIPGLRITTFGRGFSTGTELEYADQETLRNALLNRTENF